MSSKHGQFSKSHLTALWSVPGIGRESFQRCLLAQKKGELSDAEFWVNEGVVWQKAALSLKQVSSMEKFKKEHNYLDFYHGLKNSGIQVILEREKNYPRLLKTVTARPPLLFVKSRSKIVASNWQGLFLAVVGTRRITGYGQLVIKTLLRDILQTSQAKLVSGFMYGVDVAAMRLAHRRTQSIGVLGYGFDFCFPRSQKQLQEEMLAEGAIFLTTYPPATAPSKGSFVERNRLIAGLAQATLVVEAAERSGSLITANFALEMNRPVLTVPGPISNPYSLGCHHLIQSGAELLAEPADFYRALDLPGARRAPGNNSSGLTALNPDESQLLQLLQERASPLSFNELVSNLALAPAVATATLLGLEIKQLIIKQGQNYALKN